MSMIPGLGKKGIFYIFRMPEHLLQCHSFVGASQFDPAKMDVDESDTEDDSDTGSNPHQSQSTNSNIPYDRDNAFIIDDSLKMGNGRKHAEKAFKDKNTGVSMRVTAVTVRQRGTKRLQKHCSVYLLRCRLSKLINC